MWSSSSPSNDPMSQHWTIEQQQWSAHNANLYTRLPHDQVDWAQLAKQWIQMQQSQHQDHSIIVQTPPQPPLLPAQIHNFPGQINNFQIAPIEPHHIETHHHHPHHHHPHQMQEQLSRPVYQTPINASDWMRGPLIHHHPPQLPPPHHHQIIVPIVHHPPPPPPPGPPPGHYQWPPPPMTQRSSQMPLVSPQTPVDKTDGSQNMNSTASLDAAKKKNLPAWLREGLEKMEKEKVKQIQREKEEQYRNEQLKAIKQKEEELRREIEFENKMKLKSRFESDEEDSDNEENGKEKHVSEEELVII